MKDPFSRLRPFLTFFLLAIGAAPALNQETRPPGKDEQRPHWIPALRQIGTYGTSPEQLNLPSSVAVGGSGLFFVADTGNHRIQIFSLEGKPLGRWGSRGGEAGQFLFPLAVACRGEEEVLVLDAGNQRIQVFTPRGGYVREWPIAGFQRFRLDLGASIGMSRERVFVANPLAPGIQIYSWKGTSLGVLGNEEGAPPAVVSPSGIALDLEEHLYVSDAANHRIQKLDLEGRVLAQWGSWGSPPGYFKTPRGLVYARGRLSVADSGNHRVQVFDPSGTFLAQWGGPVRWPGDGQGLLHSPSAIAVDPGGSRVVLSEPLEHRCQIFAQDVRQDLRPVPSGWLNTPAEDLHPGESPGGGAPAPKVPPASPGDYAGLLDQDAAALLIYDLAPRRPVPVLRKGRSGKSLGEFSQACTLAADVSRRRYYVLDQGNGRVQAFQLTPASSAPASLKILGALSPDRLGGEGGLGSPEMSPMDALAVDGEGQLWVLDGAHSSVREFDPDGHLVADLPLRGRKENRSPCTLTGLAVGPKGTWMYVVDQSGGEIVAYGPDGRFAFSWGGFGSGDQGFQCPSGIAVDLDGFVYVADSGACVIRKFDPRGRPAGEWGRYGRKEGEFSSPEGIVLLGRDRLLVDDRGNHRGQVFTREGVFVCQLPKGAKAASR